MHAFAGDPPVEETVGELLEEHGTTVAVAETVTGGMVTALLTAVPGASEYVDRGFVPYSYDSLREQTGVTREELDAEGVVSAPVTRQLARRGRDVADAEWGLATENQPCTRSRGTRQSRRRSGNCWRNTARRWRWPKPSPGGW